MQSICRTALVLSGLLTCLCSVTASPLVSVGSGTAEVGSSFAVPVLITGASDLTSWQFDLNYDPTLFKANLVTEGTFLSLFGSTVFTPGVIDNNVGLISLIADAYIDLPPAPTGDGVLVTVEFTALGAGQSALTLSNVFLNLDDHGFAVSGGQATSIPEPSPNCLAPLWLAAIWLSSQRRARRAEPVHCCARG